MDEELREKIAQLLAKEEFISNAEIVGFRNKPYDVCRRFTV